MDAWMLALGIGAIVAAAVAGLAVGERWQPFGRLRTAWKESLASRRRRRQGVEVYVGNLAFDTTDRELAELFRPHGRVLSARVIRDRMHGRSKGYGFVRVENVEQAREAIQALHGSDLKGRRLVVNEARSRSRRS